MDVPTGAIPSRESIQDDVCKIVEFDEFWPKYPIRHRLVVGIEFFAIGLGYGHGSSSRNES